VDDEIRTRRWQRLEPRAIDPDPLQAVRKAITAVRASPRDAEARHRLRALAGDPAAREQLALLLGDEVQAVTSRDVAFAFYEELVDVHENLDQPLETIAAMEALVALAPEHVDNLDRLAWLYRRAEAWAKAAQTFERVAELSRDARAHAASRAAATLYRDHGKLEQAVAMYRAIVARRPADADAWRALDELLERLARWAELAEVRGTLATLAPNATDRAIALRAQARALEQAGDRAGAAALVARAAKDAPDHVSGLVDYASVLAREGKAREAADVLATRVAEAVHDLAPSDQIAALRLRLAGFLDDCGDRAASAAVVDELLAAAPDYAPARERLVQYARQCLDARDLRAAARAFERAAELAPGDERLRAELAEVHNALALERALARADQLPPDAAVEHLRATLADAPEATRPEHLAKLVLRYAAAVDATGDGDHAHQLLQEAHHLARRDLEITLALGESCFARKLWREAAIHLGSLAEHPDAPQHAAAVAAGLVRAAHAEVRALRPGNAAKHYEAAVRVDPRCGAAWHALAEAAAERGDMARAEQSWVHAADAGDTTVLRKLLAVQRKRGAPERGITCERLAELEADPRAKKELAEEAVQAYESGGELAAARAMARKLVAAHPLDADAIACASAVALAAADFEAATAWLHRALTRWEAAGDPGEGDPRRAELWRRLGDAERARGELGSALAAYQRAVVIAPDSDGALAARRGLVELAATHGRPGGDALAALVEAEQQPADVLAWARELARARNVDHARAMFELARALGARPGPDDTSLSAQPARAMASDEAYAGPLDAELRRELVDDPDDAPLAEVLDLLGEAAALVCPDPKSALDRAGFGDARRMSAASDAAIVAMHPQVSKVLDAPVMLLYTSARASAGELVPLLASPPVVVVGRNLAELRARSRSDAEARDNAELRYALGRVVELARPRRLFAVGREREELEWLVAALEHAFGTSPAPDDPDLAREAERLRSLLSVQLRRKLADRFAALTAPLDAVAYLAACRRAAERSGLLACGDVAVAIDLAGGPQAARHLVRLAASPRYLVARGQLTSRARSQPPRR
jgi:tetratricopeptide (TPR) repeat protein